MNAVLFSGMPSGPVPVPARVSALAGGDPIEVVWQNELDGLTFRVGAGTIDDRYIKWVASGTPEIDFDTEAQRLRWAIQWATVPRVIEVGHDSAGGWLVTEALPAHSTVEPRWLAEPKTSVPAIGRGLRILHDALPVAECPFTWSIDGRVARFEERVRGGEGPADWAVEHQGLSVSEVRDRLADAPPADRTVVCHGDPCAPNTLIDDHGNFAAHVDLGSLGTADRWADLAVATWSIEWNHGYGYDSLLYDAYGVDPDPDRIAYYRLLWDVA